MSEIEDRLRRLAWDEFVPHGVARLARDVLDSITFKASAPLFTPEEIETVLTVAANIQADCLADSWETPELCARHEKEYKTLERIAQKMSAPSDRREGE